MIELFKNSQSKLRIMCAVLILYIQIAIWNDVFRNHLSVPVIHYKHIKEQCITQFNSIRGCG